MATAASNAERAWKTLNLSNRLQTVYEEVFGSRALDTESEQKANAELIMLANDLKPVEWEELENLFLNGPLEAGSMLSKSTRDDLINAGMVSHIAVKGDDGHYAASGRGLWVYRCRNALEKLKG